jgi:hypothetical protein
MPEQTKKKAKGVPKRTGKRAKNGKKARLMNNTASNKLRRILRSSGYKAAALWAKHHERDHELIAIRDESTKLGRKAFGREASAATN